MMVEVFKTNIPDRAAARRVTAALRRMHGYTLVSCDLEDCDRVLRIEAECVDADAVMDVLRGLDIGCAVMDD